MSDNIHPFPKRGGGAGHGGGPEDPMLEQRVAQLEMDVREMKSTLKSVETIVYEIRAELKHVPKATDYASLRAEIAEVKGRIANLPTTWQMMVMLITTWSAGTAIVFALLRFAR